MKKFLSILLAVMMLASCLPTLAAEEDYKYNADLCAIVKYSGSETDLVIPSEIGGAPVITLYSGALGSSILKNLQSLTLSEGVKQLRDNNTYAAKVLAKVTLPETLEMIGRRNFYQADALTEITIPAAVAYIGQECFSYCDTLNSITFTGLCPVIAKRSFLEPAAGLVVYVPDDQLDAYKAALPEGLNVQPSGKNAVVASAAAVESDFTIDAATGAVTGYTGTAAVVEIPAAIGGVQVKSIGVRAFQQNPYVVILTLPEGLETIEDAAFNGAKALARVNFPSTVKSIGKTAFNAVKLDQLILPEGIETIGDSAFSNAFDLNKVDELVIPNSVTSIGVKAFQSATAAKIVIGENIQSISSLAFAMCNNLSKIVVLNPNQMEIAEDAFNKCPLDCEMILAEGTSDDAYNYYVSAMAAQFPKCVVNQPAAAEPAFPALDAAMGAPFLGDWYGVAGMDVMGSFIDDYPTVTATYNADGFGVTVVNGEEKPFAWYVESDYGFLCPVVDGKIEADNVFCFAWIDENGRLVMDFGYAATICEQSGKVYAAPAVPGSDAIVEGGQEPVSAELSYVPSVADDFIGGWICKADPAVQLLLLDGEANMIEGTECYTTTWTVVDGVAEFDGAKLYIQEDWVTGIVDMYGDLIAFERGYVEKPKASSAPVEIEPEYPDEGEMTPVAIGPEGEPYFGTWQYELMPGMPMILNLNQDGTCTMDMMGEVEPGVWTVQDGKANVMGDELIIDGDGNLAMPSQGMVFTKVEDGTSTTEMSEEEALLALLALLGQMEGGDIASGEFSYTDTTFVMTSAYNSFGAIDHSAYGEYKVCLKSDGTAEFMQGGAEIPSDYLTWTMNDAGAYVLDYGVMGVTYMSFTFVPVNQTLELDYYGTTMVFTPAA